MCKAVRLICVTNRKLVRGDFLERLKEIARQRPAGILLREKDLTPEEYRKLAREVQSICKKAGVPCILHSFTGVAEELEADALHLPLPLLRKLPGEDRGRFRQLGASCHSISEAREAMEMGCTYITAGHIFETDCKRGLPGRGLEFLREVCRAVTIPVYAIGGIEPKRMAEIFAAGAAGACVMSGPMVCEDVGTYFADFAGAGKAAAAAVSGETEAPSEK
ncbi:MAG TPA: thiamine phosphate synthase [Candidatus Pullilachnospira gallistercoris]|uniref:Thiamine phosphate synthase n=1 Tax=Candidatus Pullilachnospira gallistercoris TaxID=2840911 RepID=A0A9D1E9D8_9FIRM|nr:thiamine phosphate synthase [Candidatus Pullilachnospira gallistercoris]